MKSGQILLGVLVGLTAGAIVGVLFAPKKGSVTRKFISKKGNKYAGELEEKFNGFIDSINEKIESVKDDAAHITKIGKHKAQQLDADVAAFTK